MDKILKKYPKSRGIPSITLYTRTTSNNIYYYFSYKGKVYRGSLKTSSLAIAEEIVTEKFFDIKNGKKTKKIKFKTIVDKFIKDKIRQGLKEKTINDYKIQSKKLIEFVGKKNIENLGKKKTYFEYKNWRFNYYNRNIKKQQQLFTRNGKRIKGRKFKSVGNVTVNREIRLLVSILNFCKNNLGMLNDIQIDPYKMLPENQRTEVLSKNEYLKLKEYWMNKNPYYWKIISFCNNTGIRYPSELNNIKLKDVHLDKSYVMIRNRKSKKRQSLDTPVPIVGTAKEIIENLLARNIYKSENDFLFINDKGKQIKNINKPFRKSLKIIGINKELTMYSLRHLYITRMIKRPDIPIKVLAQIVGHTDTQMIDKRYSHLRTEDLVNVIQKSEKHKEEIKNGK